MSTPSDVRPEREVNRLHLMLEDWYAGVRDEIDPITEALAEDFTWIGPSGKLLDRDEAVAAWRETCEEFRSADRPPAIAVEDVEVQRTLFGLHQVTYRKEIRVGEDVDGRTCSIWLRETERVPSGLQWVHLVEVPIRD